METTANDLPLPLRTPSSCCFNRRGASRKQSPWSMNRRQLSCTPSLTDSRPRRASKAARVPVQFTRSAMRL